MVAVFLGVHGDVADLRAADDLGGVEIAVGAARHIDGNGLAGQQDLACSGVGGILDLNFHLPCGVSNSSISEVVPDFTVPCTVAITSAAEASSVQSGAKME
mgnify:CR=1 FL=1